MFSPYGYMLDSKPRGRGAASWNDIDNQMEQLTLDACDNVKGEVGTEIFAIAASAGARPGTRVHNLLKACASDTEHFFYADSAAGLESTFTAIARCGVDKPRRRCLTWDIRVARRAQIASWRRALSI